MQTARERFALAMKVIIEAERVPRRIGFDGEALREAVEAFADAECESQPLKHLPETYPHVDHASCRASLLRECGLED